MGRDHRPELIIIPLEEQDMDELIALDQEAIKRRRGQKLARRILQNANNDVLETYIPSKRPFGILNNPLFNSEIYPHTDKILGPGNSLVVYAQELDPKRAVKWAIVRHELGEDVEASEVPQDFIKVYPLPE